MEKWSVREMRGSLVQISQEAQSLEAALDELVWHGRFNQEMDDAQKILLMEKVRRLDETMSKLRCEIAILAHHSDSHPAWPLFGKGKEFCQQLLEKRRKWRLAFEKWRDQQPDPE